MISSVIPGSIKTKSEPSDLIFSTIDFQNYSTGTTLWILIFKFLQGSVATHVRCGEIFNYHCIANLLLGVPVTDFRKSVNIWRRCGKTWWLTFWTTLYISLMWRICMPSLNFWFSELTLLPATFFCDVCRQHGGVKWPPGISRVL